jgi:lysophospholipase L1-like esterase
MTKVSTIRRRLLALAIVLPLGTGYGSAPAAAAQADAAGNGKCNTPASAHIDAGAVSNVSAAAAPIKVWLAGDSTVANGSSSGACPIGWGRDFDSLFNSDVTVVNSAQGGRSIQTWLYESAVTSSKNSTGECVLSSSTYHSRWQAMLNATSGMKAGDYLLIQFGINDGDPNCPRHVGSARYKQLLGVMAQAAKQRGAIPIFLTPVSAIKCSGNTAVATRGFLTETFDAGKANAVTVIDLHRLSIALYNSLKLCPNNGDYSAGKVGEFFCNDHTHFEASGARQIGQVVTKALRDQRIGLASYLK